MGREWLPEPCLLVEAKLYPSVSPPGWVPFKQPIMGPGAQQVSQGIQDPPGSPEKHSLRSGSEAVGSLPAIAELRLAPQDERACDRSRLGAEGEVLVVQGF